MGEVRIKFYSLLATGSMLLPMMGFSTGMPVFDLASVTNLMKNYKQLKSQYDLLEKGYQNAQQQLDKANEIASDSEGHYGYGSLMNSTGDLKNREWSPDNWKSTLKGLSGGNPARYQELVTTYKKNHPSMPQSDFAKGATQDQAKAYSQDVQVNRAATVNATYAFNNIKTHLDTIHKLSDQIEQSKNTKSSMDLNSRLIAEVAYIQTQELKMQILMNQQVAQTNTDRLSDQAANAKFNRLPDE